MRAFLSSLLLILTATACFGQSTRPRPKGFLHANWGASRMEVLTMLKQQGATVPEEYPEDESVLVIKGGTFAGQEVISWFFHFHENKMYSGGVILKPSDSATSLYRDMKQSLIAKYGPHSGEGKIGSDRGERRQRAVTGQPAMKRGSVVTWKFAPNMQEKETLTIVCEASAPEGPEYSSTAPWAVTLRYTHETMKAQAAKAAAAPARPAAETTVPAKSTRGVKGDCL